MSVGQEQHRLAQGGCIDRRQPLSFTFAGRRYHGFAGDTLASALLANGVRVVGRSFKYHRPRGLLGAGVEEPNAIVQLGEGRYSEPNLRATEIELYDGLVAAPVNCWPSLGFDVGAVNNLLARFLPAGFYYKSFIWPGWHFYEAFIRRAAGLGRAPTEADPDRYEICHAHCDLLVVGGGAAGLAAARAAAAAGARVILAEQDFILGGRLQWDKAVVDGLPGADWVAGVAAFLASQPETRVLTRTTAVGYFDHNALTLVERLTDHRGPSATGAPRQRLWQVRARRVVLATGALERPLVFGGNDRPGVMLASAVRHYLGRHAVRPGRRAAIFTNNDDAYRTAVALLESGVEVAALIDTRLSPPMQLVADLDAAGVPVISGGAVVATKGAPELTAIMVRDRHGRTRRVACDVLAMSGGFNPTVHLFCQSGGKLVYDAVHALHKPGSSVQAEQSVGAAAGTLDLATALLQGHDAGVQAAAIAGFGPHGLMASVAAGTAAAFAIEACWIVGDARAKAFVDFQHDVTSDDIALAARENFRSVEHLKRYTTLGMAVDQGKTSNVNALAIMATLTGQTIEQTGTTRYRFPFTPVSLGAFAGRARGALFRPIRRMALHDRHAAHGAVFEDYGGWLRPAYYPRADESAQQAEQREARAVRTRVGLFDGSPLGKIEVVGPDAALFLDRVYAGRMSTLAIGRARYGLMLNELGVLIDDGVVVRLADDHFLVGTTSSGADRIAAWLEEWLQCEWTDLDVIVAPVTTAWAVLTLAGPKARAVLAEVGTDLALEPAAFPHMSCRIGRVADIPARVVRVSFTGELSYEINVPASCADRLWERLLAAGAAHGIEPVGIDAWMLLRTEKGYLHIGTDTDGTTSPADIGWGHVLQKPIDFIGRRSLLRPDNLRQDRLQFVGLRSLDGRVLPVGAHMRTGGSAGPSDGYVTSAGFSEALGRGVALGMVRGGHGRTGEIVHVATDQGVVQAEVTAASAYDPKGERLNG